MVLTCPRTLTGAALRHIERRQRRAKVSEAGGQPAASYSGR